MPHNGLSVPKLKFHWCSPVFALTQILRYCCAPLKSVGLILLMGRITGQSKALFFLLLNWPLNRWWDIYFDFYLSRLEELCAKSKVILPLVSLLFWNQHDFTMQRLVQEPKTCWQWARVFKVKTNAYPCFPCSCLFWDCAVLPPWL